MRRRAEQKENRKTKEKYISQAGRHIHVHNRSRYQYKKEKINKKERKIIVWIPKQY